MATVSSSTWDDVLGYLRVKSPRLMRAWFSNLEPLGTERGMMLIRAKNAAQLRYLRQHCTRQFAEAAQAATGRLLVVTFEAPQGESTIASDKGMMSNGCEADEPLNPDHVFENFVTGPLNRLAHAAAVAVANSPGRAYNPLFIHGSVGLGKTHLLQAICSKILKEQLQANCCYLSCEKFINHFISAVEGGYLYEFRYCYRHVDVLLIDDIQFLAERERSQEEFFHTFNALYQSQRQIVISADCSPREIPSLEERLISRFNSGLVAPVDPPCLETRMAIIRKKAKLRCIEVPEDVIQFIAAQVTSNTRESEGALIKIDALSQSAGTSITLAVAHNALGREPSRIVKIPAIIDAVTRHFGVKAADLQGKRRTRSITLPRQVCMFLSRTLTSHSLEEIGGYFGGRDHSTVLHAVRTINELASIDVQLRELIDQLMIELSSTWQRKCYSPNR